MRLRPLRHQRDGNILASHRGIYIYIPLHKTGMFLFGEDEAIASLSEQRAEAERQHKAVCAEKTPRRILQLELIRRLVDRPLFMVPVKDGRDVAASIEKRFNNLQAGIDRWIDETAIVPAAMSAPATAVERGL